MANKKITKPDIKNLTPPEPGTPEHKRGYRLLWDGELRGFGALITNGGVVSFIVRARIKGRERRVTLGRFGVLSVERARNLARAWLGEVAEGKDPVAEKKRARIAGVTLADGIKLYVSSGKLKASTVSLVENRLSGALADWMDRPLSSITEDQVERRHRDLSADHPVTANLVFRYFRAIWNYTSVKNEDASGDPVLPPCPVRRLTKARLWNREIRRERSIPFPLLPEWAAAFDALGDRKARVFFWFCLHTGCRRDEAGRLAWADVDLRGAALLIRDPKNKRPHHLPIPKQLGALLADLRAVAVGDCVFGDALGQYRGRMAFDSDVRQIAERFGGFGPHDLRRTFASIAESVGVPSLTLKKLMNHASGDVTAGYVGGSVERLREPMQRIADFIESACRAGGNVVPFEPERKQRQSVSE